MIWSLPRAVEIVADPEFFTRVEEVAQEAYVRISVAREIPLDEVHHHDICGGVSSIMMGGLVEHEIKLDIEGRLIELLEGDWGFGSEHSYLVKNRNKVPGRHNPDEVLVDASWQQFLPEDKRGLVYPRILIGTRPEFVAAAQEAGISDEALDFWRPIDQAPTFVKLKS